MDIREGQAIGAKAHGEPRCPDPGDIEAIEVRIMMAHGWYTGHERCDCPVLIGTENINVTSVVGK